MKKALKILLLLLVLGVTVYQFQPALREELPLRLSNLRNNLVGVFIKPAPCAKPMPYALGAFDARFGISQSYFLDALGEAEAIWEKPLGKELFTHKENSPKDSTLKINLIYDYRQEATNKLKSLGLVVKDHRTSYDTLKIKFTKLKAGFMAAKSDYNARAESFNDRERAYGEQVRYWNREGGAPRPEYDQLQAEKTLLDTQAFQLQAEQTQIDEMVNEINTLVVVLNRLASTLNISVEKYNTIGASRGESFEEGVYSSDGLSREINIYEFSSRAKLVRVLAHELGHALGLDHVTDPRAVMYELNQDNNETLTTADLVAFKTKCEAK